MKKLLSAFACAVALSAVGANTFRVTPYVQHPKPDAMTVMWLANEGGEATFEYWKVGEANVTKLVAQSRGDLSSNETGGRFTNLDALEYCQAGELGYNRSPDSGDNESGKSAPYQYRVRVTRLLPDTEYGYRVTLDGQGATYANTFRTSPAPDPAKWRGFKFIYYSDSETESSDNPTASNPKAGRTTDWSPPGSTDVNEKRTYYASQTEAYASNICAAVDFGADLIVMAGDLAQKGSKQRDWDEFWRHNAGDINDPAGRLPILASPGNHDYYSYTDNGACGSTKYLSYMEVEPNGTAVDTDQQERFHRVDYGPVTFIFLDGNKGDESDSARDTTQQMTRQDSARYRGCRAPDFNEGTEQYKWLEAQLKDAQQKSAFTFIVSHQCPFSAGYHGRENGTGGNTSAGVEQWSGRALRALLPLMHKYEVDGWLAGHDEMMERSVHTGERTLANGERIEHSFSIWDMGIAGDGLRGTMLNNNKADGFEAYRADVDSPEIYEGATLVEGGKHYGHLQVTIDQAEDGSWRATFDPIYVFFNNDANANAVYGGVRHYADKVVRISNRLKGAPPAQGLTRTSVDYSTRVPTKMPQGLVTTFWNGPLSRGFAWQTDTSVTETKLWLLKGEYDQDDGNTFVQNGELTTGEYMDDASVALRCHRLHVTGLESGATYSYRLGGNGYYAYGRFTTDAAPAALTAIYIGDTQSKDAAQLYKVENTVATAVRVAGGIGAVDLAITGGDVFDVSALANANHVSYGASVPAGYKCWKWSLMADLINAWLPGVPWIAVPGNHDYDYYNTLTAVDSFTTGLGNLGCGCSSVDLGNVHFVQLPFLKTWSSASAVHYGNVARWLEADLAAAASAKWKIVCMHWGLNTTGDHAQESGVADYVKLFAPVFSAGHVDLVLQAHDHTFSKTIPYRWDTDGHTASASDGAVLNLDPQAVTISGETYDSNPCGTYYVATGASGHRVGEDGKGYSKDTGDYSYTHRNPVVAIGKVAVGSPYKDKGAYASGDFDRQMFGVLRVRGSALAYDFYVAEADGSATLVDKLRVSKRAEGEKSDLGLSVFLR